MTLFHAIYLSCIIFSCPSSFSAINDSFVKPGSSLVFWYHLLIEVHGASMYWNAYAHKHEARTMHVKANALRWGEYLQGKGFLTSLNTRWLYKSLCYLKLIVKMFKFDSEIKFIFLKIYLINFFFLLASSLFCFWSLFPFFFEISTMGFRISNSLSSSLVLFLSKLTLQLSSSREFFCYAASISVGKAAVFSSGRHRLFGSFLWGF